MKGKRQWKVWVGSCVGYPRTVIGDNFERVSGETFALWGERGVVAQATITLSPPKKRAAKKRRKT